MNPISIPIGIQCRLASSRLPGKALLKLADTSVLGMCIQRAKNTGHPVFLLTSDQEEDDLLVDAALECGIDRVIRGPLRNVLSRYLILSNEYPCEYIIRVTADNPLTEYRFIDPLVALACLNNLPYAWIEPSLCPEGSNIEIFSADALIHSESVDKSSLNLENVTSYMRQNLSSEQCLRDVALELYPFDCVNLSFTIDTLSDYVKVSRLIAAVNHEMGVCWRERAFVKACAEFALSQKSCFSFGRNHALL